MNEDRNRGRNEERINRVQVGVVGAGNWGTALANLLALKGYSVDLWAYEKEVIDGILADRENRLYLPGVILSGNIRPSNELKEVASGKDLLVVAVPSHFLRETALAMSTHVAAESIVVSASKGIENKTHLTMSKVLKETLQKISGKKIAVLSGPSFAKEVANQMPTAVTAASADADVALFVQHVFATPYFRVYTSDDIPGVELGGAVKNVIAIAAGIVDGLGLGLNARAALITRGLAEISRLGIKLGANPHTFSGLAGIGDLMLTCTGELSRNHTVGKKIGGGKSLEMILSEMRMVAEGVRTAKSVYNMSLELGVEMPICHRTYQVLYEGLSPKEALQQLMARDLKNERDDR